MGNWRKIWIEHNGPIPPGMCIHHIIPRFQGGTDCISNLEMLTYKEHWETHFDRWNMYGHNEDMHACNMIQKDMEDRDSFGLEVVCFDKDGYKIREYKDSTYAVSDLGINNYNSVCNCCKWNDKKGGYTNLSCFGSDGIEYQFRYKKNIDIDIDYIGPVKRHPQGNAHGTKTNRVYFINPEDLCTYDSTGKAWKIGLKKKGNPKNRSCIISRGFIEITKEEYEYLKQL